MRILSSPSWWTPRRLLFVIAALGVLLVTILIWNRTLNRLVTRKGNQLFRAQIAQATSELKVEERSRLAVELHDTISQNLTGISMQIDAAQKQLDRSRDKTEKHLGIASRTLESCREELRNCIWELRNQALDEPDMNTAISRTLERHLGEAKLSVRFNVPRARLSDNTTNVLLSIIRELTVNAVRHGGAAAIRVAGAVEDGKLLFSVTDDGCGFDPWNHPGPTEGHFGIQGIRERLKRLNGTLTFETAGGRGTRAVATIRLKA